MVISPDYNPSAPFADLWVPVNLGSDAALALAMAHVVVTEKLYKADFLREQTDLPLLVRSDNHKFLTQKDVQRGGQDNIFYMFDEARRQVVEAPIKTLALDGLVPALEGGYEVETLKGRVTVRPAFALLQEHLKDYTPERASSICGVSPHLIERLAQEFATAKGAVNISSANWGKHYHGDLLQRSQILLWALCGHFGRRGASYNAFPTLVSDTRVAYLFRRGADALLSAEAGDPRFARWKQEGYTDEMILFEYMHEAYARGDVINLTLMYHIHAGLLDIAKNARDPYLKRPLEDYLKESLERGWQFATPRPGKDPRVVFEQGGSFLRRSRAGPTLVKNLLPKIQLLVTIDTRLGSTALYSDYVLPAAGWYERTFVKQNATPFCPYMHLGNRAVAPLGEAKTDWAICCLLAKAIEERARARGIHSFTDRHGQQRRLDNLYHQVTAGGLYTEEEDEAVARDFYLNTANVEKTDWEDFRQEGIAPYAGLGRAVPLNACDVMPGEPIVPLTWHMEKKQPYPTYTRRMQFYIDHDWYIELGEAFPTHKDIPPIGGDYPLQLSGGHARWSIHSCWKDNSILLRLQRGGPLMFVSLPDAQARGIGDGDPVEVFNDIASTELQAAVSPAVRPGLVIIYHDWENLQFPGKRHFKYLMPSPLNPIELVGGYYHLRPTFSYSAQPGANDRGTRVEVRRK